MNGAPESDREEKLINPEWSEDRRNGPFSASLKTIMNDGCVEDEIENQAPLITE
jgi:hypothetical protein